MKLKVPLPLPSETVVHFYPSSAVFPKTIICNVPCQNLSNFLREVLEKLAVNT